MMMAYMSPWPGTGVFPHAVTITSDLTGPSEYGLVTIRAYLDPRLNTTEVDVSAWQRGNPEPEFAVEARLEPDLVVRDFVPRPPSPRTAEIARSLHGIAGRLMVGLDCPRAVESGRLDSGRWAAEEVHRTVGSIRVVRVTWHELNPEEGGY